MSMFTNVGGKSGVLSALPTLTAGEMLRSGIITEKQFMDISNRDVLRRVEQLGVKDSYAVVAHPLLIEHIILYYTKEIEAESRREYIKGLRLFSDAIKAICEAYDELNAKEMPKSMQRVIEAHNAEFMETYGADLFKLWLQVNQVIKNKCKVKHENLVTNAYMAWLFVQMYKERLDEINEQLRALGQDPTLANPYIKELERLLVEFAVNLKIAKNLHIKVGLKVIMNKIKSIEYYV